MKKLLAFFCLLVAFKTYAQQDTTGVEQYCEVIARPRLLSSKVTIDVDYGEERSIWKDNRLKEDNGKLKKFNTVIDALNYLGRNGWKLVNAFPVSSGGTASETLIYHYVFKKNFSKADADAELNN